MGVETLAKSHQDFKRIYKQEYVERFKELAEKGQSPKTLFISCSDSRVVPNLITHSDPGDLFIDRNIGNIVPPFDPDCECAAIPASVEYAIFELHVEDIIICGHTDCGACKALYEDLPHEVEISHIEKWLRFAQPAKEKAETLAGVGDTAKLLAATEKFNIIEQLTNLMSYPLVKQKVRDGELQIQGWYYHIDSGDLEYFDPVEHRFFPLDKISGDK